MAPMPVTNSINGRHDSDKAIKVSHGSDKAIRDPIQVFQIQDKAIWDQFQLLIIIEPNYRSLDS